MDDGSCEYLDCAGECGGDLINDECGVCNGGNADDLGCGCFEPAPSGCDNECGSTAELDECGVCGGDGPVEGFDCDGNQLSLFNGLIPENFSIHSIYPNPFNPVTNINYSVPENTDVSIRVYDINGNMIEELYNGNQVVGTYNLSWDADNQPSGLYFVKMTANSFNKTQKLMLVK